MVARLERRSRRCSIQHRSPRSDPWDGSWRSARPHARSARPHARREWSVAVDREHRSPPIQAAVELEFAASARLRPSKTETPHRCEVSSLSRKSGWRDLNPRPFDPQSNALPNCATTRKEGWKCSNPPKALQPRGGANSLRVMRAFALRIDARLKTRQPRTVGCVVAEEGSRLSCLRPSLTAKVAAVRAR